MKLSMHKNTNVCVTYGVQSYYDTLLLLITFLKTKEYHFRQKCMGYTLHEIKKIISNALAPPLHRFVERLLGFHFDNSKRNSTSYMKYESIR